MQDSEIVTLYWERDESAIRETDRKYGRMLNSISTSILHSEMDAEECVNDSYLAAWNSMPENRPTYLGGYMAKIIRNLSLNRIRARKARKRSIPDGADVAFDELEDCLPSGETPDAWYEEEELQRLIEEFLNDLPTERRIIFVKRYFFGESLLEIAEETGMKENMLKSLLFRLRKILRKKLEDADYET